MAAFPQGRVRLFRMVKAKVAAMALLPAVDTHAVGLNEGNRRACIAVGKTSAVYTKLPHGRALGICTDLVKRRNGSPARE